MLRKRRVRGVWHALGGALVRCAHDRSARDDRRAASGDARPRVGVRPLLAASAERLDAGSELDLHGRGARESRRNPRDRDERRAAAPRSRVSDPPHGAELVRMHLHQVGRRDHARRRRRAGDVADAGVRVPHAPGRGARARARLQTRDDGSGGDARTDREMAGRGQDCLSRRRDHVGRLSRHGQALDPLRIGSALRARRRVPEAEHEPDVDDLVARLAAGRRPAPMRLLSGSTIRRSRPGASMPASTNGRSTSPRSEYRVPYGHRLCSHCVWRRYSASRHSQPDWDGSPFRPQGRQKPRSTSIAAFSSSTASNTGRPESSFSLLRKWPRPLRWPIGAKP